jgi:hypothetical protein
VFIGEYVPGCQSELIMSRLIKESEKVLKALIAEMKANEALLGTWYAEHDEPYTSPNIEEMPYNPYSFADIGSTAEEIRANYVKQLIEMLPPASGALYAAYDNKRTHPEFVTDQDIDEAWEKFDASLDEEGKMQLEAFQRAEFALIFWAPAEDGAQSLLSPEDQTEYDEVFERTDRCYVKAYAPVEQDIEYAILAVLIELRSKDAFHSHMSSIESSANGDWIIKPNLFAESDQKLNPDDLLSALRKDIANELATPTQWCERNTTEGRAFMIANDNESFRSLVFHIAEKLVYVPEWKDKIREKYLVNGDAVNAFEYYNSLKQAPEAYSFRKEIYFFGTKTGKALQDYFGLDTRNISARGRS